MILTCPECATRYFVDDAKLGASGRTVRCASCGSSWRAAAEEPLELTPDRAEGVAAEPRTFADPAEMPATDIPKAFRAETERKKRVRQAMVAGIIWGGLAVLFLGLFAAAYLFRQKVVDLMPEAAGAYAAVGVEVNAVGLLFEGVKAEPTLLNGAPGVAVTGTLRNVTSTNRSSPPLKVSLLDKGGKPIATETVVVPPLAIAPGQGRLFKAVLADPQVAAVDVGVDFLFEGRGPQRAAHDKADPHEKAEAHAGRSHDPQTELRPSVGLDPVDAVALPEEAAAPNALDTQVQEAVTASGHGHDAH